MTFTVTRHPKTKKQRNQPSLPRQDGCKTRKDIKQCVPKTKTNTEPRKQCEVHKTINQLQQNHSLNWLFVGPTRAYLLDFFCSGIQFNLLLSPYPCFISLLYLDLYVLGDDALIS